MKLLTIAVAACLLLFLAPVSFAQGAAPAVPTAGSLGPPQIPSPVSVGELTKNSALDISDIPWKQVIQLAFVAIIGLISLLIQYLMLSKAHATPSDVIKGGVLVLIITLSVSSLIFGFDDKQIAPIVGLFGTIIGFLLGKVDSKSDPASIPKEIPPENGDRSIRKE
jgi:hypothetical protein